MSGSPVAESPAHAGYQRLGWAFGAWGISISFGVLTTHLAGWGCPFRLLTGWDCPGCGTTRAASAVLHGEFVAAFRYNALALVTCGLLVVWAVGRRLGFDWPATITPLSSRRNRIILAAVVLGTWTVYRNTPPGHWFYAGSP